MRKRGAFTVGQINEPISHRVSGEAEILEKSPSANSELVVFISFFSPFIAMLKLLLSVSLSTVSPCFCFAPRYIGTTRFINFVCGRNGRLLARGKVSRFLPLPFNCCEEKSLISDKCGIREAIARIEWKETILTNAGVY